MKSLLIVLLSSLSTAIAAQSGCLNEDKVKTLDAQWENALLTSDADFIEKLLAEDFIWIHNHVSSVDDRDGLIAKTIKAKARNNSNTRSRMQSEVKALVLGSTYVVTGFTVVDRGPEPTTYNFMRTYAEVDGGCYLLANHTMAVPQDD